MHGVKSQLHATTKVTGNWFLTKKTAAQTLGIVCTILLYKMAMDEVFLIGI